MSTWVDFSLQTNDIYSNMLYILYYINFHKVFIEVLYLFISSYTHLS